MKKSLLVTLDYPPMRGGVASYWARVTASMPSDRWQVLTSVPGDRARPSNQVIVSPLLGSLIWPRWIRGLWSTYRVYGQTHSELLVAAQVLPVGTIAYMLHKLFGVPYVVQVYGMDLALAQQNPRKARLAKKILQSAQAIITNSVATARLLEPFDISNDRVEIVYPVPESPQFNAEAVEKLRVQNQLQGKRVVLTVGRLVERKGQDMTLQALASLSSTVQDLVYVLVGDGPYRPELERRASQLGVNALFLGEVEDKERDAWLRLCDLFVMPSRALPGDVEGFGMVYLEAGACGKPVIAGNSGGVGEAVLHGETGLLVDPNSVSEIASAISQVLHDPELAKRIGMQAQKRYDQYWNWSAMIERLKSRLV